MRISNRRAAYWDDFKDARFRDQRCTSSTPLPEALVPNPNVHLLMVGKFHRVLVWQATMTAEWGNCYRVGLIITQRSVDRNHIPRIRRCLYVVARLVQVAILVIRLVACNTSVRMPLEQISSHTM